MREKLIHAVAACAVAVLLGGCGAADPTSETSTALSTSDDVTGVPNCPGSWQYPQTYDGFVGNYLRRDLTSLSKGDLMTLGISTAAPEPQTIKYSGNYLASVFGSAMQGGTYEALEVNPLIGSLLSLTPAGASSPQTIYAVIGIRRNSLRNISALCLGGMEPEGPTFELDRIGL